jgi:hypothetical protein
LTIRPLRDAGSYGRWGGATRERGKSD